jgi:hypothetical protein
MQKIALLLVATATSLLNLFAWVTLVLFALGVPITPLTTSALIVLIAGCIFSFLVSMTMWEAVLGRLIMPRSWGDIIRKLG